MKRLVEKNINTPEEYNRLFNKEEKHSKFERQRWKLMLKVFKGGNLLDLGCFNSELCRMAKKKHKKSNIWGIDYADEVIKHLKVVNPDINYMIGNVYKTGFKEETFDYITAGELLEHLDHPAICIKEAMRILKPGGTMSISTPLEETGIGEIDKDRHVWGFSFSDIRKLLSPYGEVKIQVIGSQRFPRYIYHFPIIIAWCKKYEVANKKIQN